MLISLFRVTSWFDTVNNAVTRWMNFRENHLHKHVAKNVAKGTRLLDKNAILVYTG